MALPTTISTKPGVGGYSPPFKSSGDNFYVVIRGPDDDKLDVLKATDPTVSWTSQDTANRPDMAINDLYLVVSVTQKDDVLYIAAMFDVDATGAFVYQYNEFNMAADTWSVTEEVIESPTNNPARPWISIAVRSDGDVVAVYSGDTDVISTDIKQRVDVNVRTSGTWGGPVALDDDTADEHFGNPNVVKGPLTDDMHIIWQRQTAATPDPPTEWVDVRGKTLDPSDVLSAADNDIQDTIEALLGYSNAVSYDDSGTQRIVMSGAAQQSGTARVYINATEDGSDDIQFGTSVLDGAAADPFVGVERGLVTLAILGTDIHQLYSGGGTSGADKDLYYTKSDDDGATWDTPTEEIDGINVNNVFANIYTRGGSTVMAYVYDDNGDQKYNEKVLIIGGRSVDASTDALVIAEQKAAVGVPDTLFPVRGR